MKYDEKDDFIRMVLKTKIQKDDGKGDRKS